MKKYLLIKLCAMSALLCGMLLGVITPVGATVQTSFGGYRRDVSNYGSSAQIPYKNPNVPTGWSFEWTMSAILHSAYIQSGWAKSSSDSSPRYFVEYYCPGSVCRTYYGSVPSGTTHTYKIELDAANARWCGYIDGVSKKCVSTSTLGMTTANVTYYSGETSDTQADMGGTATSHLHMYDLRYKNTSNTWYQVNYTYLVNITTSGTPYRASTGYTSPYAWVENWTQR